MKISRNPMLAFQQGKKDGYSDGVGEGFIAFSYVALLGAYNVWEGEQDDLARFFRAWEKECVRIYRDECHENPEELKDALMGHTKELRVRMGLD